MPQGTGKPAKPAHVPLLTMLAQGVTVRTVKQDGAWNQTIETVFNPGSGPATWEGWSEYLNNLERSGRTVTYVGATYDEYALAINTSRGAVTGGLGQNPLSLSINFTTFVSSIDGGGGTIIGQAHPRAVEGATFVGVLLDIRPRNTERVTSGEGRLRDAVVVEKRGLTIRRAFVWRRPSK